MPLPVMLILDLSTNPADRDCVLRSEEDGSMLSTAIDAELREVATDFRGLIGAASSQDLQRQSSGTRWTNRQLLFHVLFGYLIVRTLLPLVHLLGRLGWSRRFAATLNAAQRPFHLINYLGSVGGGTLLPRSVPEALMDRTLAALRRRLAAETEDDLRLSMHFPADWDPYFRPTMTVLEVYHYGTEHYYHHRGQLRLDG